MSQRTNLYWLKTGEILAKSGNQTTMASSLRWLAVPVSSSLAALWRYDMKWILPLVLSVLPLIGYADIYKCQDEHGKTTYSQHPCGDTVELITVNPTAPSVTSPDSRSKFNHTLDAIDIRTERRRLERHISLLKARKRSYSRKMDAELSALRQKKLYANNNLAGATWEESISTEMVAVTESYKAKMTATQHLIDEANRELKSLESAQEPHN